MPRFYTSVPRVESGILREASGPTLQNMAVWTKNRCWISWGQSLLFWNPTDLQVHYLCLSTCDIPGWHFSPGTIGLIWSRCHSSGMCKQLSYTCFDACQSLGQSSRGKIQYIFLAGETNWFREIWPFLYNYQFCQMLEQKFMPLWG